jgi:CheY-like chemotaxis protein
VLVAVDNPAERASWSNSSASGGCTPPAPDATAPARTRARRRAPCRVALISTQLPDTEGFQLAEAIRGASAPPCIIMLAGEGRRGDGARCRELGIAAYLPMPALASDLASAPSCCRWTRSTTRPTPLITRHRLREQRRQLRVLLAEDNPVNRTLALRLLGKLGHQVEVANNGEEALALHARGKFDIILMDVQMPVMGGFEATARIREREAAGCPHTPIVAMTAHAMKGDRERCLEAGMDGYLSKPVHAPDLVEALIHHTGNADPAPPRAEPMADDDPVFERDKALFNLGDDTDLLEQLIVMYAEDEPRLVQDIDAALAAGDPEALSNAAHALKGAVSNFCAPAPAPAPNGWNTSAATNGSAKPRRPGRASPGARRPPPGLRAGGRLNAGSGDWEEAQSLRPLLWISSIL